MIVGLLGFIGSGKGTAGDILKDIGFTPLSFAKGVKDVTSEMFGWPRHLLEGDTQQSREWREQPDEFWSKEFGKPFTPRYALQLMGTEVGRDVFHKDFWIIKLKKYVEEHPKQHFVITDVRFMNEVEFVYEHRGILIEIERGITPHWYSIAAKANKGDPKAERYMLEESGAHESEWRWIGSDKLDYTIQNMGTIEKLKTNLVKCLTNSYGTSILQELK